MSTYPASADHFRAICRAYSHSTFGIHFAARALEVAGTLDHLRDWDETLRRAYPLGVPSATLLNLMDPAQAPAAWRELAQMIED